MGPPGSPARPSLVVLPAAPAPAFRPAPPATDDHRHVDQVLVVLVAEEALPSLVSRCSPPCRERTSFFCLLRSYALCCNHAVDRVPSGWRSASSARSRFGSRCVRQSVFTCSGGTSPCSAQSPGVIDGAIAQHLRAPQRRRVHVALRPGRRQEPQGPLAAQDGRI